MKESAEAWIAKDWQRECEMATDESQQHGAELSGQSCVEFDKGLAAEDLKTGIENARAEHLRECATEGELKVSGDIAVSDWCTGVQLLFRYVNGRWYFASPEEIDATGRLSNRKSMFPSPYPGHRSRG